MIKPPKPKVLIFDIESTPNLGYVWGKYEQDVIQYKKEWEMLCFAYKWLGEREVRCVTREGSKDDKTLCLALHDIFNQADILVAHNGDQFDIKKARARFVTHGFKPTKIIPSVDTKKIAKANFNFNSNKLDDLGQLLGLGRKQKHTGFELWLDCMADKPKAWKLMAKYNIQDVRLLERVYLRLMPWIKSHPSVAAILDHKGCPKCGSRNVIKRGIHANNTTTSQQMFCKGCHGWYLTRLKRG